MPACADWECGILLHAYELGLLSEEETEQFEAHLLGCAYCFNQVIGFERESLLILSDKEIRRATGELLQTRRQRRSLFAKLRQLLWPTGGPRLVPALAYVLVVAMLIPTYRGLRGVRDRSATIQPVETVELLPTRSESSVAFSQAQGRDGVISFVTRGITSSGEYRVTLMNEEGHPIAEYDVHTDTEEGGVGAIYIPVTQMQPGEYRLLIRGLDDDARAGRETYWFRIVE